MVITYSKGQDQPRVSWGCQSCSWSAEEGKWFFTCPYSRQRIWSRERGSAVPSRINLLIFIPRLNLVLTYGILPEFRGGVCACMYVHTCSKSMDQPGMVANPARGQLNRENEYFPVSVRAWEFGLTRRVRQSRPASACLLISILRLNLVLTYGIPPEFREGVHIFI